MMDAKRIEELRQLAAIHPKSQWLDECIDEIERLQGVAGRAFVEGAKWWEFHKTGATMWQSDQQATAEEAAKRKMPFREPIESRLEAEIEQFKAAIWSDDSTETERGKQTSEDAARFVSVLRARVGRLINALKKYGRHKRGCEVNPGGPVMAALGKPDPRPCTCGFSAFLSAENGG
jgi:DNA polymerase/3'-5' exonuclease PolX